MQTIRPTFRTVVAVLSVAFLVHVTAQTNGNNTGNCFSAETCAYTANCTFNIDLCPGWMNEERNDTLDWEHAVPCTRSRNISGTNCMTVNFTNQPKNSVARLHSPWMCVTRQNASLSFKYAISGGAMNHKCPLSVRLTMNSSSTPIVWKSPRSTGTWFQPGNVEIPHPDCPFKIVFEAQKLKEQSCGSDYDEINLAEVMFEGVAPPLPSPPTSTATATEMTTIAVDTTTVSNTDESTGEAAVTITTSSTVTVTPDANCTFNSSLCPGWMNEERDDTLDWEHAVPCTKPNGISGTNCLTVNFTNEPKNSVARLHSPWMCATGQNASLSFQYAIAGLNTDEKCPLSVLLTTSSGTSIVWTSSGATQTSFEQGNVEIPHPDCPFQVVFEARRLKQEPCGIYYDEINLADVVFEGAAPPSPSPTSPITTYNNTQDPMSGAKPDAGSLSAGAAAGIGVGVIVIIVLLIGILVILRRRGRKNKTDAPLVKRGNAREKKHGEVNTFMNQGYSEDDNGRSREHQTAESRTGNCSYEMAGIIESSPVYSTPVDAILPSHQITATTDKIASDSGDIHSKPYNRKETGDVTTKPQTDTSTPANVGLTSGKTEEHQYNKLFLENPRAARADHTPLGRHAYDHLEGVVHGLEKGVQPSDQSGKPHSGYVNVDAATPADTPQPGQDVYNTLDKEHRAKPPAVYANGGAVYNHLNEQVAIVNPPATGKASSATRLDTELYMNVGPDGVKTAPRPASGDVYNKLDFDVKNPGQANPDASDVYNHTA